MNRLRLSRREEVFRLENLVEKIARKLDSVEYDKADPTLEPTLDGCRQRAADLRHWMGELSLLVEMEHSG